MTDLEPAKKEKAQKKKVTTSVRSKVNRPPKIRSPVIKGLSGKNDTSLAGEEKKQRDVLFEKLTVRTSARYRKAAKRR